VCEARLLYQSAITEADAALVRHKKTSIGSEIEGYQARARHALKLLK